MLPEFKGHRAQRDQRAFRGRRAFKERPDHKALRAQQDQLDKLDPLEQRALGRLDQQVRPGHKQRVRSTLASMAV